MKVEIDYFSRIWTSYRHQHFTFARKLQLQFTFVCCSQGLIRQHRQHAVLDASILSLTIEWLSVGGILYRHVWAQGMMH